MEELQHRLHLNDHPVFLGRKAVRSRPWQTPSLCQVQLLKTGAGPGCVGLGTFLPLSGPRPGPAFWGCFPLCLPAMHTVAKLRHPDGTSTSSLWLSSYKLSSWGDGGKKKKKCRMKEPKAKRCLNTFLCVSVAPPLPAREKWQRLTPSILCEIFATILSLRGYLCVHWGGEGASGLGLEFWQRERDHLQRHGRQGTLRKARR